MKKIISSLVAFLLFVSLALSAETITNTSKIGLTQAPVMKISLSPEKITTYDFITAPDLENIGEAVYLNQLSTGYTFYLNAVTNINEGVKVMIILGPLYQQGGGSGLIAHTYTVDGETKDLAGRNYSSNAEFCDVY